MYCDHCELRAQETTEEIKKPLLCFIETDLSFSRNKKTNKQHQTTTKQTKKGGEGGRLWFNNDAAALCFSGNKQKR